MSCAHIVRDLISVLFEEVLASLIFTVLCRNYGYAVSVQFNTFMWHHWFTPVTMKREDLTEWKPVRGNPTEWNPVCTKTTM